MLATEHKGFEGFDIPPDGQIDDDVWIRKYPQASGIACLGLQSPNKPVAAFGEGVDGLNAAGEAVHHRAVERRFSAGDVDLREVVVRHGGVLAICLG